MAIRFKSTFSAQKRISEIQTRNKVNLGQALSDVKADMLIDIAQGKGYDGAAMKAYSDKKYFDKEGNRINFFTKKGKVRPLETYKEYKLRKLGTAKVNLTETGKMLKAMQVSVLETKEKLIGRLFFLAGERNKARWNLAIRKFFGLSKGSTQKLNKRLGIK